MSNVQKFIYFSILAGILTHPIWNWSFKTAFIPKPSDFFFVLAILGSVVYFLGDGRQKIFAVPKLLYAALFLFGASIALGTVMGHIRYGIPVLDLHSALYHLVRIGGGFVLCLFVYVNLSSSGGFFKFRKALYGVFAASSLLFVPFLLALYFAEKFSLFSGARFLGFSGNAGMFAILAFPSFVFVFFLFLRALFHPRINKRVLQLVSFGFLWLAIEMLILWSGTRSYFGAVMLAAVVGTVMLGLFYRVGARKLFASSALVWLAAFLPLFLFPGLTHSFENLGRYPAVFRELGESAQEIRSLAELQTREELSEIPKVQFASTESRLAGFQYYFSLLKADPLTFLLGLGINYEHRFSLAISTSPDESNQLGVGRSILFDIFLYGGIGAAIAVALLAWMVWQRIIILFHANEREQLANSSRTAIEPIYVLAPAVTLLGWWAAAVFLGTPFTLIPTWILLAMALV